MDLTKFHSQMKDDLGRFRTQSLFWETRYGTEDKYPPLFTLKSENLEKDGIEYISLKKIYMSYDHIPNFEYEFALTVFNSWEHWQKLANDSFPAIRNEIKSWREELDIRLKAQALKALILASKDNDPKGIQAARYLAEKGYLSKRGRPSKGDIEREVKLEAGQRKQLQEDLERIGLKIMEGGK